MKRPAILRTPLGVDPLRVAGAFGALAGVGSVVVPYLLGLTEVLAAVGAVAGVIRLGRTRGRGRWALWFTPALLVGAGSIALLVGPPWSVVRGAALGLATAALAVTAPARTAESGATA
jgi:hypothetical protein